MDAIYYLAPVVFLLAGTVKGGIGIGLPTTSIALLSQVADPRLAVACTLMPIITSNFWQVWREGRWRATLQRFWPFSITLAIVIYLCSNIAAEADADVIKLATGGGIAIFAAASLIRQPPALPPRWERPAQIFGGAAAGLMGGFTGLWSPPLLILLLSLRLEKSEFIGAMGLLLLLGGLPFLGGYFVSGQMSMEVFLWSLVFCIPTFLGFTIGEKVRRKMDAARFQKVVLIFFLIMGLNMIRSVLF